MKLVIENDSLNDDEVVYLKLIPDGGGAVKLVSRKNGEHYLTEAIMFIDGEISLIDGGNFRWK